MWRDCPQAASLCGSAAGSADGGSAHGDAGEALLDGAVMLQRLISAAGVEALFQLPRQSVLALFSMLRTAAVATASASAAAAFAGERERSAEAHGPRCST